MNGYLLDTHAALWLLSGDSRLPHQMRSLIDSQPERVFVSAASVWEVAIKRAIGRLDLAVSVAEFGHALFEVARLRPLPIQTSHVYAVADLPLHHRDPFDRILIAQAIADGLEFVSADEVADRYGIKRMW